jgi:hypothetical protein
VVVQDFLVSPASAAATAVSRAFRTSDALGWCLIHRVQWRRFLLNVRVRGWLAAWSLRGFGRSRCWAAV